MNTMRYTLLPAPCSHLNDPAIIQAITLGGRSLPHGITPEHQAALTSYARTFKARARIIPLFTILALTLMIVAAVIGSLPWPSAVLNSGVLTLVGVLTWTNSQRLRRRVQQTHAQA